MLTQNIRYWLLGMLKLFRVDIWIERERERERESEREVGEGNEKLKREVVAL